MADDFIDRSWKAHQKHYPSSFQIARYIRADRFWKLTVIERRRIRVSLDCRIVYDLVNGICRYSGSDSGGSDV